LAGNDRPVQRHKPALVELRLGDTKNATRQDISQPETQCFGRTQARRGNEPKQHHIELRPERRNYVGAKLAGLVQDARQLFGRINLRYRSYLPVHKHPGRRDFMGSVFGTKEACKPHRVTQPAAALAWCGCHR
jgi:hypothetical protein